MKDLGEASYVLGIQIHCDYLQGTLGLSQKGYIEKVPQRFNKTTGHMIHRVKGR